MVVLLFSPIAVPRAESSTAGNAVSTDLDPLRRTSYPRACFRELTIREKLAPDEVRRGSVIKGESL